VWLRDSCMHYLWNYLAKCNILFLYLDAQSEQRILEYYTAQENSEVTLDKALYIISGFQNNHIPSMLHYTLENRLVELQVQHDRKTSKPQQAHKETQYFSESQKLVDGDVKRHSLLLSQKILHTDMLLNKIELAKWAFNEMWGTESLKNAAIQAGINNEIVTDELPKLSKDMLLCAVSWMIFARHYSAEMIRINSPPEMHAQFRKYDKKSNNMPEIAQTSLSDYETMYKNLRQKYEETQQKYEDELMEKSELETMYKNLKKKNEETQQKYEENLKMLKSNSSSAQKSLSDYETMYKDLKQRYEKLEQRYEEALKMLESNGSNGSSANQTHSQVDDKISD